MEHRQVDSLPATSLRASGDDPTRFLRELRQLRDGAGLGPAELAARAHYPSDRIRAAEVGPTLPDLPVLSAYVRGCGGTTEEWEERWRSLTSAPTLPVLDARPAGESTAASAGARIGSITPAADTPDPAVILAALDRVGEEMAVGTPAPPPVRTGVTTIEPRPVVPPMAVKTASAKAAAPKVVAWETTTMRTAWSSTTGSAWATSTGAAGAAVTPVTPGTAAAAPASMASAASSLTSPTSPTSPTSSSPTSATPAASGVASSHPPTLSRTTLAALVAIAICLLVALLAIVA